MGSVPRGVEPGAEYDYIVCGGGTAGCVVAGRLAEDADVRVLLLEAGPHSEGLENVHMVGGWSNNFDGETDWNIVAEPGPGIDGRRVKLSRGKFLGGSSGCNGTLCIRGSRRDYDDWRVPGWAGDDFFPYMSKAESFRGKPWFRAAPGAHGHDGPLATEPHDLAPISRLVLESMQSKGLPLDHDMFSHGDKPHGCGHAPRTVGGGRRATAADFVTGARRRDNLCVVTGAHVDRVLMRADGDGGLRAVGVRAVLGDGSVLEAGAAREVVVSGGAYCSPNLLNRSGIGARGELETHGIETLVDLPGVGKNLMDHVIVFIFYEADGAGLTTDHLVHHGGALAESYRVWKESKAGFLSTFPFGAFAFARLDERLADSALWRAAAREPGRDPMGLTAAQPNVEFFSTECYGGPKQYDCAPGDGQSAFAMIAELFGPRSRGTVALRSAEATAAPLVDCGFLEDALDVEVLAEACRFANEIVTEGAGTRGVVKGSWPPGAAHHAFRTRAEWVPYVKEHATTCYHAAGTCAMGAASDPQAVVDEALRVKGVRGLRVADASIMPLLPGGHTQMPAYGIGEKAADLIKAAWAR